MTDRTRALDAAGEAIEDRDSERGDGREHFHLTAEMWGDYLGIDLEPHEVAELFLIDKLARSRAGPNPPDPDQHTDAAGYAALADWLAQQGTDGGPA